MTHPLTAQPLYRGEVLPPEPAHYYVWEPVAPGREVVHRFEDEFLAQFCAVQLGTTVDRDEP